MALDKINDIRTATFWIQELQMLSKNRSGPRFKHNSRLDAHQSMRHRVINNAGYQDMSLKYPDNAVAFKYLATRRGMNKQIIHNLLQSRHLRSSAGYQKFHVYDQPSQSVLKTLSKRDKHLNAERAKHHQEPVSHLHYNQQADQAYFLVSSQRPWVEFPWYDSRHEKAIGADQVWLQGDKSQAQHHVSQQAVNGRYGSYHIETVQIPTNGRVDNRQVARHSKRGYGFNFQTNNGRDSLYVFTNPLNALSYYNLHEPKLKHTNSTFLSLNGTNRVGVINNYLRSVHAKPGDFKDIYLCPDNNQAGHNMVEKIMARQTSKVKFAHQGSAYLSPVTHSRQHIYMSVPGVFINRHSPHVHKSLGSKLGQQHWQSFSDVLQCVRGKDIYKRLQGTGLAKSIYQQPDQLMDNSQYTQMLVDDCIGSVPRVDQNTVQKFFYQSYGLNKAVNDKRTAKYNRDSYRRRAFRTYYSLKPEARHQLQSFLIAGGGKYVSPRDMAYYAYRYSNHQSIQGRNLDTFGMGTADQLNISARKFSQGIHNHITGVMHSIHDPEGRRMYDLALKAKCLQVDPVAPKYLRDTPLGKIWQHDMSKEGQLIYRGTMRDLQRHSMTDYLFARSSVDMGLGEAYRKNAGMSHRPIIQASAVNLQHYGLKPITFDQLYRANQQQGTPLYYRMRSPLHHFMQAKAKYRGKGSKYYYYHHIYHNPPSREFSKTIPATRHYTTSQITKEIDKASRPSIFSRYRNKAQRLDRGMQSNAKRGAINRSSSRRRMNNRRDIQVSKRTQRNRKYTKRNRGKDWHQ